MFACSFVRLGRLTILIIGMIGNSFLGIAKAFSANYSMFIAVCIKHFMEKLNFTSIVHDLIHSIFLFSVGIYRIGGGHLHIYSSICTLCGMG